MASPENIEVRVFVVVLVILGGIESPAEPVRQTAHVFKPLLTLPPRVNRRSDNDAEHQHDHDGEESAGEDRIAHAGPPSSSSQRPASSNALNPLGQLTTRSFDLDGKLLHETKANGTVSDYSYTTRDWLAGIQHRLQNGNVLDTFNYYYTDANNNYDPTGHLQREVDAGNRAHAFFYKTGEMHQLASIAKEIENGLVAGDY